MKSIAILQKSILALTLTLAGAASASADVIADWTFETSAPTTAGPFAPEIGSGSALALHASSSTVYSTPAGNGSTHSFSSNFWTAGDYYQFTLNTSNFSSIDVAFDQTSSSTGPRDYKLAYSTNGGATFTDVSAYTVLGNGTSPNTAWNATTNNPVYNFNFDLSGNPAVSDQTSLILRLINTDSTSAGGGTVGTAGTDRVDNFTVTGTLTAVPEPTTYAFGLAVIAAAALHRRRQRVLPSIA